MSRFHPYQQDVVDTARKLVRKGYLMATGGNLSVRIPGENAFAVTPSNYDYAKMEPEDVCVLRLDDLRPIESRRRPSVESAMHAGILRARKDVHAVVHTHQVAASALSLIREPIPALFDEQARFLGRSVEIIPYMPSGTSFLVAVTSLRVRSRNNAYILANHGALALGPTTERAMHNVEILEKCAEAYLLALRTGRKPRRLPWLVRERWFRMLREDQAMAERGITSDRGE